MIAPVELRGQFVWLQPLSRAHLPQLQRLAAGPRESFRWTTVPTPETAESYLSRALAAMDARQALAFATCLPSGEMVGSTRLFDLQRWDWPSDPRAGEDVLDACEIGYTWLAASAQRTRVNTEAKLLMLRHAFAAWKCRRVTLKTDERNTQSRRAIERLGAKFDGILRASMAAVDNTPRNSAYYSILSAEWPAVEETLVAKLKG